jgi:hypothetical protein
MVYGLGRAKIHQPQNQENGGTVLVTC